MSKIHLLSRPNSKILGGGGDQAWKNYNYN